MANILDWRDVVPEMDVVGPVVGVALQMALDLVVCSRSSMLWSRTQPHTRGMDSRYR